MSKKLSKNTDYFEGYHMLAIVSQLPDYTLCYHINKALNLDLIKYDDLIFALPSYSNNNYSWYYFNDKLNNITYYLIENKSNNGILIPSQRAINFFLIIHKSVNSQLVKNTVVNLNKVPAISAVLSLNMQKTTGIDLLLHSIELHEMEYVKKKSG